MFYIRAAHQLEIKAAVRDVGAGGCGPGSAQWESAASVWAVPGGVCGGVLSDFDMMCGWEPRLLMW